MCIKSKRLIPLIGMSRKQKSGSWDQYLEEAVAEQERRRRQHASAVAAEELEQYLGTRQHQNHQIASLSQNDQHQSLISQEALVRHQDPRGSMRHFLNSLNTPFHHDLVQSRIDEQVPLNIHNINQHGASAGSSVGMHNFRNPLNGIDFADNHLPDLHNHSYINTNDDNGSGNRNAFLDAVHLLSQPLCQNEPVVPTQQFISQPRPSLYYQAVGPLIANPSIADSAGRRIAASTTDTNLFTQPNMSAQRIQRQDRSRLSPHFNSQLLPVNQPIRPPGVQLGSLGQSVNVGAYSDLNLVLDRRQQPLNMATMMPNRPTILTHPTASNGLTASNDLTASTSSSAQRGQLLMRRKSAKTFEEHFQSLLEFKDLHGHCNVPHRYKENTSLGNWCNNIRTSYRKMKDGGSATSYRLTNEQIRSLEKIGFKWRVYYRNANTQRLNK